MEIIEDTRTDAQKDELYQDRIARCTPVAKAAIAIVAKNLDSIVFGENADCTKSIIGTASEVLELFLTEDIHWSDRLYITQMILQPFAHLNTKIVDALDMSWDKAVGISMGKDYLDLKFSDVDEVLKRKPEVVE